MGGPDSQPVGVASPNFSAGTSGDFIAFGLFIGLLIGAFGWMFHAGGREARAAALTSFGRAVGSVLCVVGVIGYLAAAAVVGVGGYGAWQARRAERGQVAEFLDRSVAGSTQATEED